MDVVVEIGGWEHSCCGSAVERGQLVDLGCLRVDGRDGSPALSETHHDLEAEVRVRGRVVEVAVVRDDGSSQPIDRIPSGRELRQLDDDPVLLEAAWTGELLPGGTEFLVVVRTA
ncbi:hypothetical protein ACUN7V_16130 [Quadrisphaera oryzae]|uniref:hypothetical protein n=1 Tax=Quadrisphaera TaxID=317661 RepID=UPI001646D7ED|nr:hypothetical protein [Quadrisphaera sp. RL12-1S]MBC3763553.1 hypothetical protein [Quadrisphaera sp. RL12-1S]